MSASHMVSVAFFGSTKDLEASLVRAGEVADEAGNKIGGAFEKGGQKAGGAMSKLGNTLGNFGLPFGESISKVGEHFSEIEGKGKKLGAAMSEIGKVSLMAFGAGAVAVGTEALKMGSEFQIATNKMAGEAGIPVAAAQKIGQAFLATAGSTTFSAAQMMGAIGPIAGEIENLTGHTLTSADSMKILKGSMDLAEASGEPLKDVTKSLVDVMLPFHMKLSQSSDAANILWNTQRSLGVSTSDLSKTYQRLVPRVAGSGMSLQQMSGFVVELSHSLGGGRQALRTAGTAIQGLVSPSSTANKALAAMGIQLFDSHGKFIGMGPAIAKMKTGLASLPGAAGGVAAAQKIVALTTEQATLKGEVQTKAVKAQEKAIAGQLPSLKLQATAFTKSSAMQAIFGRSANGMLAVIAGGSSVYDKYTKSVGKAGEVQSAAEKNAATLEGEQKKLKSTVEDLGTSLGTMLVPQIQKVINVGLGIVQWAQKNSTAFEILAGVVGGVLVAAIGVYVGGLVAATATSVASFATMIAKGIAWAATNVGTMATWVATTAASVGETIALWAMYAAEWLASTAASAATFVATHAAMAASFIAENVAMIASATAAFVAENLATLGIIAGITLLVGAVIYLATHWQQVWGQVKAIAIDAWHFLDDDVIHPIEAGFQWLVNGIASIFSTLFNILTEPYIMAWHFIENVYTSIAGNTSGLVSSVVGFFSSIPGRIESFFSSIASFISGVWNTVTTDASNTVNSIINFFAGLPGKIIGFFTGLPSAFASMGSHLVSSLVGSLGNMGSGIMNSIKKGLPHTGVVGSALNVVGLATGGLVSRPTLAVVGEAGPEMVIPLSKLPSGIMGRSNIASLGSLASITGSRSQNTSSLLPTKGMSGAKPGGGNQINLTYSPIVTIAGTSEQIASQTSKMISDSHDHLVDLLETRLAAV